MSDDIVICEKCGAEMKPLSDIYPVGMTCPTAREFYDTIAYGGKETPTFDSKTGEQNGFKTTLSDGSIITWRNVSHSDGSPAVDINIERSSNNGGIKQQKIHFVKGSGEQ